MVSKDDPSPLGPESDEEKSEEAKKNAAAAKEKDQDKDEDKTKSGDAKAGDTKDGSEQESDRTRAGVSLTGAVGSVDWRGEARRLEQNPRLARLHGLPARD